MFSTARRVALPRALGATTAKPLSATGRLFSPAALGRLLSSLAILEQRDGKLNLGSLSAVTAAQKLGGSVHCFVAGKSIGGVAEEAAKVGGVEKVVKVESEAYEKVEEFFSFNFFFAQCTG